MIKGRKESISVQKEKIEQQNNRENSVG